MPSETCENRESWHDLLEVWGVSRIKADQSFDEVCNGYDSPGRFYHTLDHIRDVLKTVQNIASFTSHLTAVKLAAWLHDVIYDSKASDNEEKSTAYAERLCQDLSISVGPLVASLILKTKTHDADEDPDALVLIDADLAILGASEAVYWAYAQKIRMEYDWVPEMEYRKGRRQVLERFLSRPKIFHFLGHLEEPARRNIAAEIERLVP